MTFNSLTFALFMLGVFTLFWGVFNRAKWQGLRNAFLLAVSYWFYGAWDWRFLTLIVFSSAVDYAVGLGLERTEAPAARKRLLVVSLVANLGLLAAFKYFNFFIDSALTMASWFGWDGERLRLDWILPVGISFYTFQTLSYTLDVYRDRMKATHDPIAFFTFVAFFPQLVAGPIERARHLLPQFDKVPAFDSKAVRSGMLLIMWGLFKKVVLADRLALFVNHGYADTAALDGPTAFMVWFFFPWQLYLDFSAYSDIAIGAARMLGFELTTNFRRPMLSVGLTEFWKRWHITLTRWFREYLFLPIRRSREVKGWAAVSVLIVFLATGLWHGASWNFVFWGLWCGLGLLLLEPFMQRILKGPSTWIRKGVVFVMSLVYMYSGLVWFRSPDWSTAMELFAAFGRGGADWSPEAWGLTWGEWRLAWITLLGVISYELYIEAKPERLHTFHEGPGLKRWAAAWLLLIGLILMGSYGVNIQDEAFIYFQF